MAYRPQVSAVAVAVVMLAAVVIFNAPARGRLVEASAGRLDQSAAVYIPFVGVGRPAGNCDPAYPTVCIPTPPPNLNCPDLLPLVNIPTLPPDPHGLDADKDGIGCEFP